MNIDAQSSQRRNKWQLSKKKKPPVASVTLTALCGCSEVLRFCTRPAQPDAQQEGSEGKKKQGERKTGDLINLLVTFSFPNRRCAGWWWVAGGGDFPGMTNSGRGAKRKRIHSIPIAPLSS